MMYLLLMNLNLDKNDILFEFARCKLFLFNFVKIKFINLKSIR